ncbi:PER2 [Mytilus coruscus]|uniref:PER2 n=1 Tax=Mytilus coruscus TaxID=42192 RepID=A0A6J8AQG1_MYTCO|nr:PER2 [Mytilus coruscus]
MDNQKFIDSTYGSFSGFISSNSSSYSMSLSDSEFPEEQPSTSGCSSDFAHSTTQKDKRKERLKQYLRQLKQIVNPAAQSGAHVSTLGALRHVINSIQKNKEDDKNESSERCISICSTSESEVEMNILSLKAVDDLQILVSTKGMKIVQVSPSLKKILGYPVDSWIGRELTSFLHRKDVVTVNSSYVLDDPDKFDTNFSIKFDEDGNATSEAPKKVFYCRLRHYKSLKSGFNLAKKDQYTSFQASVSMKKFNSDKFKPKQFLLLECQPLNSAYNKNWSEMSTEKKTFGTRHSLFCSYTYIHPNAIPLLGYLPQDMVGMSIFDFYHPEEFEQLYNIYRQVVSSKGTTISSPKIRFRTHNGDWIYVKTEWSSFINPWSKRLEFIIGQHTVIKGPQNIDVFSPPPRQECIAEEPEQYHKNLRLIRKLLLQPVVDEARSVALNIVEEPTEEVSVSPTPDGDKEETSIKTQEAKKKFQSATRNEQRNEILNDNLSGTYEQLSYTNNIKRFLMSQPKTYSSSSHKSSGNDSYTDDSNAIDSDEVPDFGVDISYPKPPSFCSSTKVLVSEKEDMVPSPSCQTEEIVEETSREAQIIFSAIQEPNVLMSLTQETLQEHTKRQEKMYLEQAKQDSNLVLLNMTSKYSVQQESSQGLKRGHSTDLDETRRFKSFKAEDVSMLCPPFPMTTTGPVMKPAGGQPKIAFSNMYGIGLTQGTGAMYHGGPMPVVQLPQQPPITNGNPGKIQWPYYPQSGLSFYPQVMGGFYQPMTVLSYPMPLWTGGDNKGVTTTKHKAIFTQAGDKGNTAMSVSDSSSGENTSSSFMYLLELSNNQEIAKAKESKASTTTTRKRHSDPPWLFGVLWVEGIQMRYTVPRRKFNRTMKEDRDALKLLKQSDVVLKQMEELKENIEKSCQEPTEDEEADYLFMIDPDLFKDDSSSDSQEIEVSEKLRCSLKSFSESKTTDETITKSGNGDDNSFSETRDSLVGDEMDDQEKKSESECDSLPKSGYNDSSVDMESASYKSSDLTPSDSRSTDDKGSSMKESDTQSSKLSEGNKDSESENDLNQTQILDSQFDHFFVKIQRNLNIPKKASGLKKLT